MILISWFLWKKNPQKTLTQLLEEWCFTVGRPDLIQFGNSTAVRSRHRVCSEHFDVKFVIGNNKNRTPLHPKAVPTLKLPASIQGILHIYWEVLSIYLYCNFIFTDVDCSNENKNEKPASTSHETVNDSHESMTVEYEQSQLPSYNEGIC